MLEFSTSLAFAPGIAGGGGAVSGGTPGGDTGGFALALADVTPGAAKGGEAPSPPVARHKIADPGKTLPAAVPAEADIVAVDRDAPSSDDDLAPAPEAIVDRDAPEARPSLAFSLAISALPVPLPAVPVDLPPAPAALPRRAAPLTAALPATAPVPFTPAPRETHQAPAAAKAPDARHPRPFIASEAADIGQPSLANAPGNVAVKGSRVTALAASVLLSPDQDAPADPAATPPAAAEAVWASTPIIAPVQVRLAPRDAALSFPAATQRTVLLTAALPPLPTVASIAPRDPIIAAPSLPTTERQFRQPVPAAVAAPAPAGVESAAAVPQAAPPIFRSAAVASVPPAVTIIQQQAAPIAGVAVASPTTSASPSDQATLPAPAILPAAASQPAPLPQPLPIGVPLPAARIFAAAIAAASRTEHRRDDDRDHTPALPTSVPSVGSTGHASPADRPSPIQPRGVPVDTRRDDWVARLADHVEAARDAANARDTRIRLVPDALGRIDIAVRQEGETLHVHFSAESAATRLLLHDAQPRLAEIAEQRGLRLGQSSVEAGLAGQDQRRAPPAPLPPQATANRAIFTTASEDEAAIDHRIA